MGETMSFSGFWFCITLINTFFLFLTFGRNILLSKKLEFTIGELTEKKEELANIESTLGNKITSLMGELEKPKIS